MKYVVHEHRFLLKFFAAKSPLTVLLFLLPLSAILVLQIQKTAQFHGKFLLLALPLSFLYWSLVEYLIHRSYFHWVPKNQTLRSLVGSFHLYHHENPSDLQVINSGWVTAVLGVLLHWSIFHFLFRFSELQSHYLTLALIIVYYFYEWIHYMVHQRLWNKGPMKYLQNFHLTHHVRPKINFGQITPIWDYLLGTVGENMDAKDHPRMRAFIKGQTP